jgi:hypothetical protein
MNKTQKIVLSLIALSVIILPLGASALSVPQPTPNQGLTIGSIVDSVVRNLWIAFAGIAIILFVYSGVLFLLAGGSPEKVQAARQAFMWGVIGVVVMVLAYSIFFIATNLISGSL